MNSKAAQNVVCSAEMFEALEGVIPLLPTLQHWMLGKDGAGLAEFVPAFSLSADVRLSFPSLARMPVSQLEALSLREYLSVGRTFFYTFEVPSLLEYEIGGRFTQSMAALDVMKGGLDWFEDFKAKIKTGVSSFQKEATRLKKQAKADWLLIPESDRPAEPARTPTARELFEVSTVHLTLFHDTFSRLGSHMIHLGLFRLIMERLHMERHHSSPSQLSMRYYAIAMLYCNYTFFFVHTLNWHQCCTCERFRLSTTRHSFRSSELSEKITGIPMNPRCAD